jgi:transcriptional regulator with XRE-family HTH domain
VASLDEATRRELGQLLREMRTREGLTLNALSEQVGVTASALSQFETGKSEPSLGTLWKLGRALNASLFDFFAQEPARSVDVTRAVDRTTVTFDRYRYEAVARSDNRKIDLFFLHLEPGDGPVRDAVSHAGEECGVVLQGAMDVFLGDDRYRLETGDGIWFDSALMHTFAAIGDETCISVWADSVPDHADPHRGTDFLVDVVAQATHTDIPSRDPL